MHNSMFAFTRTNYVLIALGVAVVVIGLLLMGGSASTQTHFNPNIFSTMRIRVAPALCFIGYVFTVFGIMHKPKDTDTKQQA